MEQHLNQSIRTLTLPGFMASVEANVKGDSLLQVKRTLQMGIFEEMWQRVVSKQPVSLQRTYLNIGLLTRDLDILQNGNLTKQCKKELKDNPRSGRIRARFEYHSDIRYILTSIGDCVYLIMDNAALDAKMATVMIYDREAEGFVESTSLYDFTKKYDVIL